MRWLKLLSVWLRHPYQCYWMVRYVRGKEQFYVGTVDGQHTIYVSNPKEANRADR